MYKSESENINAKSCVPQPAQPCQRQEGQQEAGCLNPLRQQGASVDDTDGRRIDYFLQQPVVIYVTYLQCASSNESLI